MAGPFAPRATTKAVTRTYLFRIITSRRSKNALASTLRFLSMAFYAFHSLVPKLRHVRSARKLIHPALLRRFGPSKSIFHIADSSCWHARHSVNFARKFPLGSWGPLPIFVSLISLKGLPLSSARPLGKR